METEEKKEAMNTSEDQKYESLVNGTSKVALCLFGVEDVSLLQKVTHVIRWGYSIRNESDWRSQINNSQDAIKFYKNCAARFRLTSSAKGKHCTIQYEIINSFLTEDVYNDKSIKYSNIIQNRPYQNYVTYLRTIANVNYDGTYYGVAHAPYTYGIANLAINTNQIQDEIKEDSYTINDDLKKIENERMTLRTKHILAADAFIIICDCRYQSELDKVKKYLDEIFKIKGYDKLLPKVRNDEMCLFPIAVFGINWDVDNGDKLQKISRSQINQIALDYCIDGDTIRLFHAVYGNANAVRIQLVTFAQSVLDYYYYRSLDEQSIKTLKARARSDCLIL